MISANIFKACWIKTLKIFKERNLKEYSFFIKIVKEKRLDPFSPTQEVLYIYRNLSKFKNHSN